MQNNDWGRGVGVGMQTVQCSLFVPVCYGIICFILLVSKSFFLQIWKLIKIILQLWLSLNVFVFIFFLVTIGLKNWLHVSRGHKIVQQLQGSFWFRSLLNMRLKSLFSVNHFFFVIFVIIIIISSNSSALVLLTTFKLIFAISSRPLLICLVKLIS